MEDIIEALFIQFDDIRYVAIYQENILTTRQRNSDLVGASSGDSDTYEELLVNPTLLKLATQRGDIDCGGLSHLNVCYGNFTQIVKSYSAGHISICLDKNADLNELPLTIFRKAESLLDQK